MLREINKFFFELGNAIIMKLILTFLASSGFLTAIYLSEHILQEFVKQKPILFAVISFVCIFIFIASVYDGIKNMLKKRLPELKLEESLTVNKLGHYGCFKCGQDISLLTRNKFVGEKDSLSSAKDTITANLISNKTLTNYWCSTCKITLFLYIILDFKNGYPIKYKVNVDEFIKHLTNKYQDCPTQKIIRKLKRKLKPYLADF